MNIIACVKQVPSTEAIIKVLPDGSGVDLREVQMVVNPYDEYAVEEALRIKERLGKGEVTIVTMGPAKAKEAIRNCLAMGADKGLHLMDDLFLGSDSLATAMVLAAAVKRLQFDLILCGKQAVDDDQAQTGGQLAELLGIPHVCVVTKLEFAADGRKATVRRQVEGGSEIVECPLPALFTCQKGLNEPRYPSLKGIMGAKKKEITELKASDLGLSPADVGSSGSKMKVIQVLPPPQRSAGKIIQGEPAEAAKELARLLREQAKVI